MTIRVLLVNENGASFIEIDNTNDAINKALGWDDAWNTPTMSINGERYIIICSDTGKLRKEPVSAISMDNLIHPKSTLREPFVVGAIIVTKFDGIDDLASLNDHDVELLTERLFKHENHSTMFYQTLLVID